MAIAMLVLSFFVTITLILDTPLTTQLIVTYNSIVVTSLICSMLLQLLS